MKIAVIGAGVGGLATAYFLGKKGHRVTVFEKETFLGGLAASFSKKEKQWPLEGYPHHLFVSDGAAKKLLEELGLTKKLFFLRPKTSVLYGGKIFPFDGPLAILKAPFFSWPEKIRIGLATVYLKLTPFWRGLDRQPAEKWLKKFYGQRASQIIWEPLLREKFHADHNKVSMAWLWGRIKKRSSRLGYLSGGWQILLETLAKKIKEQGGEIKFGKEIKDLTEIRAKFEKTVFTGPLPVWGKIAPKKLKKYRENLEKYKTNGAVCLTMALKKGFLKDKTYWLNVNEAGFPFVFLDEHTNFVSPRHYQGKRWLYVGGYYPPEHRYFKMEKEEIWAEFAPFLKKINPEFKKSWVTEIFLKRDLYAQPITPVNYGRTRPAVQTPLKDVLVASLHQIYPWDRGINYAVELAAEVSQRITEENDRAKAKKLADC